MTFELTLDTETIQVRIRDRSGEAPWGVGMTNPYVRTVTISAFCLQCGTRRGEPRNLNQCDDGVHYSVDIWKNPCGHTDYYEDIAKEANRLVEMRQDALLRRLEPGDVVEVHFNLNRGTARVLAVDLDKRHAYLVNVDDHTDEAWVPVKHTFERPAGS